MIREAIYLGRSNTIDWQLQEEKVAVDLSSVTRMVVEVGGVTLDSLSLGGNGVGNVFHWVSGVPADGVANLFLMLGGAAQDENLITGRHSLRLIVYDPDNPEGLVWVGSEPVLVS